MPETVRLPDSFDGAELRAFSLEEGQAVRAGEPLASLRLDDRVVVLPSPIGGSLLRRLVSEEIELSAGDPIALIGAPGETVGYDPSDVECVRVLLLNECSECGGMYPVNGMVERTRCIRCGDLQRLTRGFWRDSVLENVEQARTPGARGGGVTLGGPTIECRGLPPLCRKCFTLLDASALTAAWRSAQSGQHAQIVCAACGEAHAARMPPAWALEVFEGLSFLVGETTAEAGPDAKKPVVFKCPSCLAALEIAGERRIVRCKYCEADVYLPDDLWLHFNPSAKRGRWTLVFAVQR